jgi:hypothetical protein
LNKFRRLGKFRTSVGFRTRLCWRPSQQHRKIAAIDAFVKINGFFAMFVTFFALMQRKATGMGGCAQRKIKDHMNAPRIGPGQRLPRCKWIWKFSFTLFSSFPPFAFHWLLAE